MKRLLLPFFLLTTLISIAQIRLVEDILPGVEQSNPFQFLEHDGFLFFIGQSTGGPAIFMMDTNETISIAWQEGFNAYDMVVYNNDLYFNANNQLHRLNRPYGTGAGSTVVDSSISMWGSAFVYNGELYFGGEINQADPLNPNHELMAFNGTTVRLVEDQSTISLDPSQYVEHLGELYFVGKESATVGGLLTTVDAIYRSDGTSVEMVTFFENTSVSYLTSLGDNLYFLYRNGDFNQPYNLWYNNTNGTGGFGVELNFAFGLTVFENKLLFFDQDNTQLVSRDILGNEEIIPIAAGLEYPLGGFPLQNQNYLAFSGFTNAFGSELYIYEAGGEINFTEDYNSGSNSFTPVYGSFFNGNLYVTGSDGSGIGRELHVYNPNGCNETVNIPDANFEAYLENVLNVGDGIVGNGLVCKEKVEVLTALNLSGSIPIVNFPPGLGITNLAGIENFSALEVLRVEGNNIASIDLSQNTSLRELRAWRCNIQTLNVSGLTNLQTVGLNFNSITTVDFATCPAIQELDITNNDLTAIQLGTKANLLKFTISNNPNLASLDISGADTNLSTFDATGNTTLTCIQVSNVANAENQANWLKDANTSYSTNCNPQPFTVTASIPGTSGNPPAIEITEGNSFTLNFNADATAQNGTVYNPIILVTKNGVDATADFSITGLNQAITVANGVNPDGSISFTPLNDGNDNGNEVYTITIESENTGQYTIAQPTTINITVIDQQINETALVNVSVFKNVDFAVNPINGPVYQIKENRNNEIFVEVDLQNFNSTELSSYQIMVVTRDGSATASTNDYNSVNETYTIFNDDSFVDSSIGNVRVNLDQILNEPLENFFIDIIPISANLALVDEDLNTLNVGETLTLEVEIENNNLYNGESILLSAVAAGDVFNEDGKLKINEGGTIEINIDTNLPNEANGFNLEIPYFVSSEGTVQSENPLILTVDNSINPDGSITIDIPIEASNNLNRTINIQIEPDSNNATFEWENGLEDDDGSGLNYGQRIFEIEIMDVPQQGVYAKLSNRGGSEGWNVNEKVTLSLENGDGNPYITDRDLIFPVSFSVANINIEQRAEEDDYTPLNNFITVFEGNSTGTLEISYENNIDEDTDHEFYNLIVQSPLEEPNINLPNPYLLKIIDKDGEFEVFLTLIDENLISKDDTGSGCCPYFIVEEGSTIVYEFNAEKGVPEGTKYNVELEFSDEVSNPLISFDVATENVDYLLTTENINQRVFEFEANDDFLNPLGLPDNRLLIRIPNGDELGENLEGFSIFFDKAENSNNSNFKLNSFSTDFLIDEPVFASIQINPNENLAKESPLTPASFIVSINEESISDIKISYELDEQSSADEDEDFEILLGEVTIPAGQLVAEITVIPKDDDRFEGINETVIINLLDGSGYTLSNSSRAQIEIESEDEAEYTATIIQGADNASRESQTDDFAEVILELNESPVDDTIEVFFKISDQTDQNEVIEGEGQDYLIYQADKKTVIPPNNRKVVFEANGENRKSIFVKALLDDLEEDNESLFLELDDGVNYRAGIPNEAQVILQSATTDLTSFKPASISVVSKKPRCPGDNQEGFIEISNASGFEFDIVIYNDTENEVDRFLLGTNSSDDRLKNSKPLTIGRYEVILEFKGEKPENAIAPRYVVQIEKLEDMSVEEQGVDLKSKTGSFLVSGSQSYTLSTEIGVYNFDFEDTGEHLITLPLEQGLNSIKIKGDAICQGTIKKEILMEDIYIFPNPSYEIVSIMGESLKDFKSLVLFDMQGKLVFEKTTSDRKISKMEINISSLQRGMYLGKILKGNNQTVEFKLIKR
ncbi:T9SS type A sorting domain-containing protein [Maribacter flavus]|nr:T9SS type A sorting domain-containing protein [Maribacter flavus]